MPNPIPSGRHSIRLKGYDYSRAGIYFITICTHNRQYLLGEIEKGRMLPNRLGLLVQEQWRQIPEHWPFVDLLEYCLMPNHVHGIIVIKDEGGRKGGREVEGKDKEGDKKGKDAKEKGKEGEEKGKDAKEKGKEGEKKGTINCAPTGGEKTEAFGRSTKGSIPTIVKTFKAGVTRQVRMSPMREIYDQIWQRGYYEHIIRSEGELIAKMNYIKHNPQNWDKDLENIS